MAATTGKRSTTAGSQQMVATSTNSLLEQQNFSEFVLKTGSGTGYKNNATESPTGRSLGTQITPSLMPRKVPLNAPATEKFVEDLRKTAANALQEETKPRLRADIPTADLVTRGSFKVGTKLLIKIDPSAQNTQLKDYIPQLTFDAFSLQGVAEPDEERYQLHETFDSEVLFLFGRRPRIWTLQGIVLNGRRSPNPPEDLEGPEAPDDLEARLSKNMDFANTLLQDWEDFYRGSKAVEAQAKTYISYEDSVIEGTLLGLTVVRNAQIPSAANATLTFVVHQRAFVGQEYRNGITAPNLAQLIDETNSGGPFGEKVSPSEITPAEPTLAELRRREKSAEGEVLTSQEATRGALEEKNNLEASRAELNSTIAAEQAAIVQARQDIAAAGTPEELDAAKQAEQGSTAKLAKAQADLQAVQKREREIGDEVTGAVATEEDATAKRDSLAATGDKTS